MKTLRRQHEQLQKEVYKTFFNLLEKREKDLVLAEHNVKYDDCDSVDIYHDLSGETESYYVVGVSKTGGIICIEVGENVETTHTFSSLSNLLDQITVIELLEQFQNQEL